jgi:hypothetical protein
MDEVLSLRNRSDSQQKPNKWLRNLDWRDLTFDFCGNVNTEFGKLIIPSAFSETGREPPVECPLEAAGIVAENGAQERGYSFVVAIVDSRRSTCQRRYGKPRSGVHHFGDRLDAPVSITERDDQPERRAVFRWNRIYDRGTILTDRNGFYPATVSLPASSLKSSSLRGLSRVLIGPANPGRGTNVAVWATTPVSPLPNLANDKRSNHDE